VNATELAALQRVREARRIVRDRSGAISIDGDGDLVGWLPPLYPEWLGDRSFAEAHGIRFPYATGSMANGIATPRLVVAVARAGMLGFFGAAGLPLDQVEAGVAEIERALEGRPGWGANLIHSPSEPELEAKVAELYLRRGVRTVEASAFLQLTPSVVRFAVSGLRVEGERIVRPRRVVAKVSRPEVARPFMSPAPAEILAHLRDRGQLSEAEASLAARVAIASDVTVEADSGGHTDNRPLAVILPAILALRDQCEATLGTPGAIRVGAAGGLGTPAAVAAAFALGAAYVMTGSINQAAVESGLSDEGKRMLAQADMTDVAMAAAADMFELGVKLQVLRRGSLFAVRANRLYELYRSHDSLDALPEAIRGELEGRILGAPLDRVWRDTEAFWRERDPAQCDRAASDPRHRMALLFRWYLGMSSQWAIAGDRARQADYQIWCGPAMGAFNRWVAGSFLEDVAQRSVVQIARNLLEGAAVVTRAHQVRSCGVAVPPAAFEFRPRKLA
jgi:PfaD family protein